MSMCCFCLFAGMCVCGGGDGGSEGVGRVGCVVVCDRGTAGCVLVCVLWYAVACVMAWSLGEMESGIRNASELCKFESKMHASFSSPFSSFVSILASLLLSSLSLSSSLSFCLITSLL